MMMNCGKLISTYPLPAIVFDAEISLTPVERCSRFSRDLKFSAKCVHNLINLTCCEKVTMKQRVSCSKAKFSINTSNLLEKTSPEIKTDSQKPIKSLVEKICCIDDIKPCKLVKQKPKRNSKPTDCHKLHKPALFLFVFRLEKIMCIKCYALNRILI